MQEKYGIILDMDGVLVDSNPAHYESWMATARAEGFPFSHDLFQRTFGQTSRAILAAVCPERSADELARLDRQKEDLYREIAPGKVKMMPGAMARLREWHERGYVLAVGSSGPGYNVHFIVDLIGIRPLLSAIVSGTDVQEGKPSPEIFLKAAKEMGLSPDRCLVIDDSESGMEAGCAAGMKSIGFFSEGHRSEEYGKAAWVVTSWSELSPTRVRELLDKR